MNNRETLLKCSLDLFASRGYDAVGVQEIVDAAGLKKPTLYHYFGSKSGLLATLLSEQFNPFYEKLQEIAAYTGDLTGSLKSVAGAYFDYAHQNPSMYRFILSLWFAPPDSDAFKAALAINLHQQELLETMFMAAAQQHGNMKGRHRSYAASYLGIVNTYILLSLNGYADLDDAQVHSVVHQFMHGIFS